MRRLCEIVGRMLPMDKASRMARARTLGFTIPTYHGTGSKFTAFDLEKGRARVPGFGFAPHFANRKAEATGYAGEKENGRVLAVLLRLKNPFVVNYDVRKPEHRVTPEHFRDLTGEDWDDLRNRYASPSLSSPPSGYNVLERLKDRFKDWDAPRRMWAGIYHYLMQHGYDALVDPECPADHSAGYYTKYVVFEPKNIRLTSAVFDPANSDSADLRA